jgi:hypothetical protein
VELRVSDPRDRLKDDGPGTGLASDQPEAALRAAADRFMEIVTGLASARLLEREGAKLPQAFYDKLTADVLSNEAIEKIAADGFEGCVRALAALGAKDVSIFECRASDMELDP